MESSLRFSTALFLLFIQKEETTSSSLRCVPAWVVLRSPLAIFFCHLGSQGCIGLESSWEGSFGDRAVVKTKGREQNPLYWIPIILRHHFTFCETVFLSIFACVCLSGTDEMWSSWWGLFSVSHRQLFSWSTHCILLASYTVEFQVWLIAVLFIYSFFLSFIYLVLFSG